MRSFFSDLQRIFSLKVKLCNSYHCYPPVEEFVEIAGEDYAPYFVDRIPLIIYDLVHSLPSNYTNSIRTSIDFAPTLLHLLNIPNVANHFLGASLFDRNSNSPNQFAAIGEDIYLITEQRIIAKPKDINLAEKYFAARSYVNYLYDLELKNRVFPLK
jgi:phosphoglycerol transferase MdoB-like AlkP superfamily enzyme